MDMRIRDFLASLALLSVCFQSPARADDCLPLRQFASIDAIPGAGGRLLLPVSINGTPQQMLLATAGGITSLRQEAVDAMGLHPIDASHIRLLSSNGTASQSYVQIDFLLGNIRDPDLQVIVLPPAGNGRAPFAGALAGDFLSLYDVEIDFADHKVNFFSKDHCPGHVIYWHPTAVAVVPISLQKPTADPLRQGYRSYTYRGSHIIVPVTIQGKEFKVALDTSSQTSTMSTDTAKYIFGVTADSPGAVPLGSVDDNPDHKVFSYSFPTLTFDTVTVSNARFRIVPNLTGSKDPNNSGLTESRIFRVDDTYGGDITIGLDVLRHLRLFVAYGESKLYVTPASAPVTPPTQVQTR
jgi:hypothetical protein